MKKSWLVLLTLLLAFPLMVAACGGDDKEEENKDGDSSQLSETAVEEALNAMFTEGNIEPMKAITCAAEQPSAEEEAATTDATGMIPPGASASVDCTRADALMKCTVSMTMEGLPEAEALPMDFNIVDEKLCGAVAAQ